MKVLAFILNCLLIVILVMLGCLGFNVLQQLGVLKGVNKKITSAKQKLTEVGDQLTEKAHQSMKDYTSPDLSNLSDGDLTARLAELNKEHKARKAQREQGL